MEKFRFEEWKNRLLELTDRNTEKEDEEYVDLVDQISGICDQEIIQVLMKTFTNKEDYGVQESVVSALTSSNIQFYHKALLKELPRLIKEAPEWAETLVGKEIEFNFESLVQEIKKIEAHIYNSLLELIDNDSFRNTFPNTQFILKRLR